MEDADSPLTKRDLQQLKDSLIERMRDMQTELLRGFSTYADGMGTRMRKIG